MRIDYHPPATQRQDTRSDAHSCLVFFNKGDSVHCKSLFGGRLAGTTHVRVVDLGEPKAAPQLRRAISIRAEGKRLFKQYAIAPSAARLCSGAAHHSLLPGQDFSFARGLLSVELSHNTHSNRGG